MDGKSMFVGLLFVVVIIGLAFVAKQFGGEIGGAIVAGLKFK